MTAAARGAAGEPGVAAREFRWLVEKLAADIAGAREVVAVSADGLLMAAADPVDPSAAQRLAAIVSGTIGLAGGAARTYHLGGLHKIVIDLSEGYVVITALSAASVLGVVADRSADLGSVAYEMTLFAARVGHLLTPATILELKTTAG